MIPARQTEIQKIVAIVDDVDLPNRIAHVKDKTHVTIQASFRDSPGGITHVPSQGERWVISRIGHGPWYLVTKLDSVDEHEFMKETMSPGDTRLSAEALHMQAGSTYMNGQGLGYTVKDNFYSASGWTTVTLASDPTTPESIHPVLNGMLITPDLYRLAGRVITFNTTMALGSLVVTYQVWQRALVDANLVIGRARITSVEMYTQPDGDLEFDDHAFQFQHGFGF